MDAVIIKFFFIVMSMAFVCHSSPPHEIAQHNDASDCMIVAVRDSTLFTGDDTIGYEFICNDEVVNEINFFKNNPWRQVRFPLLPDKNPYLGLSTGDSFERSFKHGFIYFDLGLSSWPEVKHRFKIHSEQNPDSLYFTYAKVDCRTKSYLPHYILTNYWLSLTGVSDTNSLKSETIIFPENQLKVYGKNGEIVFSLMSNEFILQKPQLDSAFRIIVFRSFRLDQNVAYSGFEIHDFIQNTLLQKFEADSTYGVMEPALFGNYILVEIMDKLFSYPVKTIVYDISRNVFYIHDYSLNYRFRHPIISKNYLIYNTYETEEVAAEYDTIIINDLTPKTKLN
jgi:hypothetical protein